MRARHSGAATRPHGLRVVCSSQLTRILAFLHISDIKSQFPQSLKKKKKIAATSTLRHSLSNIHHSPSRTFPASIIFNSNRGSRLPQSFLEIDQKDLSARQTLRHSLSNIHHSPSRTFPACTIFNSNRGNSFRGHFENLIKKCFRQQTLRHPLSDTAADHLHAFPAHTISQLKPR